MTYSVFANFCSCCSTIVIRKLQSSSSESSSKCDWEKLFWLLIHFSMLFHANHKPNNWGNNNAVLHLVFQCRFFPISCGNFCYFKRGARKYFEFMMKMNYFVVKHIYELKLRLTYQLNWQKKRDEQREQQQLLCFLHHWRLVQKYRIETGKKSTHLFNFLHIRQCDLIQTKHHWLHQKKINTVTKVSSHESLNKGQG